MANVPKELINTSQVFLNQSQESGKVNATSPDRPGKVTRPGWPEIAVGLIGLGIAGIGSGVVLARLGLDPVLLGVIFTALSGIGGIVGFAAAASLRIRSLSALGVRQVSGRWLPIGVGAGVVAFVLKSLAILAWIAATGDNTNVQGVYATGGSGGALSLVLSTVFLALLTPLGEELLFRGVVANALLRYGAVIGVVGSALIFAVSHGINPVFPAAVIVGLIAGELFRRTGSIWPGFVVHAVVNLPTVPLMVLAGAG